MARGPLAHSQPSVLLIHRKTFSLVSSPSGPNTVACHEVPLSDKETTRAILPLRRALVFFRILMVAGGSPKLASAVLASAGDIVTSSSRMGVGSGPGYGSQPLPWHCSRRQTSVLVKGCEMQSQPTPSSIRSRYTLLSFAGS